MGQGENVVGGKAYAFYSVTPFLSLLPRHLRIPATPFFMASCKGRNGLQDLMRYTYCRRAIFARYHRPRARAGA